MEKEEYRLSDGVMYAEHDRHTLKHADLFLKHADLF